MIVINSVDKQKQHAPKLPWRLFIFCGYVINIITQGAKSPLTYIHVCLSRYLPTAMRYERFKACSRHTLGRAQLEKYHIWYWYAVESSIKYSVICQAYTCSCHWKLRVKLNPTRGGYVRVYISYIWYIWSPNLIIVVFVDSSCFLNVIWRRLIKHD